MSETNPDGSVVLEVDARRVVERTALPPIGTDNSELTAIAGRIKERDLRLTLGWQGTFSVESLCSRLEGGASSFFMLLAEDTPAGGRRFYVPTLMGLFPGQRLKIDLLEEPLFTLEHLGQDAKGPFFETRETAPRLIPKLAQVYNKNNVNVLSLSDTSNCDNQGATINLHRRAYGAGDVFLFTGILDYQSNIHSALGDEGGVAVAINLQHDLGCFHGVVKSWAPGAGRESEVEYQPTSAAPATQNTQKLGTSRPLVNLNRNKWSYVGDANVLRPGTDPTGWGLPMPAHADGCILLQPKTPPADWKKFLGAFIALVGRPQGGDTIDDTDASEHYRKHEETPLGKVPEAVYRWWYITDVEVLSASCAYLYVDRIFQRDREVVKSGPLLFLDDNYTESSCDLASRRLKYIVAPGAWVSDVRDGVAGNVLGNRGAQPTDPRRILLAPGQPDLAAGDPITNPPGPDVGHPTGFRARQLHHFPATEPGSSFLSENEGRVQIGSGLHLAGSLQRETDESIEDALKRRQKDGKPQYDAGLWFTSTAESAIRIQGYSRKAALELAQAEGDQKILWWNHDATGFSTFRADRASGNFVFDTTIGTAATLTGSHGIRLTEVHEMAGAPAGLTLTRVAGISGTATRARNLRGTGKVTKGDTRAAVKFLLEDGVTPNPEPDRNYRVFVQCRWLTGSAVVHLTENGFEVELDTPAPAGAELDWLLVR